MEEEEEEANSSLDSAIGVKDTTSDAEAVDNSSSTSDNRQSEDDKGHPKVSFICFVYKIFSVGMLLCRNERSFRLQLRC